MPPPAEKIPTTGHSECATWMDLPTSRLANSCAAPTPTITSFLPHWKGRPFNILMSSRTWNAAGSTPRMGTLASVRVERLRRFIITNSSADASGPLLERATPGASAMMRVFSLMKPLTISLSAPPRKTMAASAEPDVAITCLNPAAMERTATRTPTTPATPTRAAKTEPSRCGTLSRPNRVVAATCENQLTGPAISHPPQGIGHSQAHRLQGGKQTGRQTETNADEQPDHQVARWQKEQWQTAAGGVARSQHQSQPEPNHPAQQ